MPETRSTLSPRLLYTSGSIVVDTKKWMAGEKALSKIQAITAENPYTGEAEQIVTLSLGIFEASGLLSKSTFSL